MRKGFQPAYAGRCCGVAAITALMHCTSVTAADTNPLTQLNNLQTPERLERVVTFSRSLGSSSSAPQVQMKQGEFFLDPTFIPTIQGESGYLLMQVSSAITDAQRTQLAVMGVSLLEYIPDNTWVSSIPGDSIAAVHALSFVRALGHVYPSDKLPAELLKYNLPVHGQNGQNLTLNVSFHGDTSFKQAKNEINTIGGHISQHEFSSGHSLIVEMPSSQLLELAYLSIVRWIEEPASPISPDNVTSASQLGVDSLHQAPLELNGAGIIIAGWEGAAPQKDHPDLIGRVTIAQGGGSTSNHATHVTGTLISSGANNSQAKGMAPKASYVAYDFFGDIPREMHSGRLTHKASLNNHSWGYISGWSDNYYQNGIWTWFGNPGEYKDSEFGRYGSSANQWDAFIEATDTVVVKSAGNNRNDDGPHPSAGHHHHGDPSTLHYDEHGPDGDYDSIDSVGAAKNVITVGAVDSAGQISNFSGWGPADDGRIKPDVVANGLSVYSTTTNSSYANMSGSSMATPAVTGALALISELHDKIFNRPLGAATAKALVAHTARDKGIRGPDYSYGWGIMDASSAANILKQDNGSGNFLSTPSVTQGTAYIYPITVAEGDRELKTTIAWTDPSAAVYASKALVNDLDLELVDPLGNIYYPFTLSGLANPTAPATQDRPNRLDNVEQVKVIDPAPGEWSIRVVGHSVQSSQEFSLVSTSGLGDGIESSDSRTNTSVSGAGGGGGGSLSWMLLFAMLPLAAARRS